MSVFLLLGSNPLHEFGPPVPPPHFILQNPGKTAVLPVLPHMAPLLSKCTACTSYISMVLNTDNLNILFEVSSQIQVKSR